MGENINHISNKGLIPKIYNEIIQQQKKNTSIKKWEDDLMLTRLTVEIISQYTFYTNNVKL